MTPMSLMGGLLLCYSLLFFAMAVAFVVKRGERSAGVLAGVGGLILLVAGYLYIAVDRVERAKAAPAHISAEALPGPTR